MAEAQESDPPLDMGVQHRRLVWHFPQFQSFRYGKEAATWWGTLSPTSMSPDYRVQVDYRLGERPKVYVRRQLDLHPKHRRLPHTYSDGTLCLYDPRLRQWNGSMLLSETTVPWTALWLYHYESWLFTGEWDATESHPDGPPAEHNKPSERGAA
jgi:hypothetical protein